MSVKKIKEVIKKHDKFIITAHVNAEGDSIGSQIALRALLMGLGKKVVILNESSVPRTLRFMKTTENILKEMHDFNFQIALVLDCPSLIRIGNISKYITEDKLVINIDHHISNEHFGKYNWVDEKVSSAGEMIFKLYKEFGIKIGLDAAVAMYVAIMTDTGSFKYTNTSSSTHMIVAELIDLGVKPYEIYEKIYETTTPQDINLLAEVLKTLRLSDSGKVAWFRITKETLKSTKASLEGTEGIINFARSIDGVEVAMLFRETGSENRIKVSFRSKGRVNVNKLALFFEGGGHKTASGCNVIGKLEEVEKKVVERAESMVRGD